MVDFGDVRSLLQLPPSHQSWAQLCAWVERSEGEELEQVVLPYVRQHLERWPWQMRSAPRSWLERMMQDSKRALPEMALVSTLDLRSYAPQRMRWDSARHEDVSWILKRGELRHVQQILLNRVEPTYKELNALVENQAASAVERLELSESLIEEADARRLLLDVHQLVGLRELVWSSAKLDDGFVERLVPSALGAQLERLELVNNELSHEGLARLLGAGQLDKLRELSVGKNKVEGRRLGKMRGEQPPPALRALSLEQLNLGGALPDALGERLAGQLERLDLWKTSLGAKDVAALAAMPLGALRVLELSKNEVGEAGAQALAASDALGALEELTLFDAKISDDGALALVEAAQTKLPKLKKINLLGNSLSAKTLYELEASGQERGLTLKLPQ